MRLVFQNATVVNPDGIAEGRTLVIERGKFARVERDVAVRRGSGTLFFDAANWLLFPALINLHDHLRGTWLPRCGNGPYENVYQWLRELHATPSLFAPARERDCISMAHLYWLGTYKNLLSGVTTVVDHYVRLDRSFYAALPIRLITDFGREGVVRSINEPERWPSWGKGIVAEYRRCAGRRPFVIHVEEGVDEETGTELRRLERLGVLGPTSILIHGIGFDDEDIELVARRKCHMVWCPGTHEFLYGRTGNVAKWLERGINTTLGTDSSLTGGLNLLDEMRIAVRFYGQVFGRALALEDLYKMVTVNPARALMMRDKLGRIAPGYLGDLLILERRPDASPLETLVEAEPQDVVLLLQQGRPRYGDEPFASLFKAIPEQAGSARITVGGKPKRIVGNPVRLLRDIWKEIGRRYHPSFLPFDDTARESG
jgi:cytosine/adenosine deaminase-related metal-dependent hydrolase